MKMQPIGLVTRDILESPLPPEKATWLGIMCRVDRIAFALAASEKLPPRVILRRYGDSLFVKGAQKDVAAAVWFYEGWKANNERLGRTS